MSKFLKRKVYITLNGTGKKTFRVPVKAKPLKRALSFFRSRADVEHGVEGECATCANSIGASRSGLADLVQFTDSRVYLVDKFNKKGVPIECSIGTHRQGAFQRKFDANKKKLLKSSDCEGVVKIMPLSLKSHHSKTPHVIRKPVKRPTATAKKRTIGAAARAERAGIAMMEPPIFLKSI